MKFAKVLLVTILTLIFFTGCAQMQQSTGGTSASPVLDRIQRRGELVVGTMGNMPPLNMTAKDGEIFGLEPDLAGHVHTQRRDHRIQSEGNRYPGLGGACAGRQSAFQHALSH